MLSDQYFQGDPPEVRIDFQGESIQDLARTTQPRHAYQSIINNFQEEEVEMLKECIRQLHFLPEGGQYDQAKLQVIENENLIDIQSMMRENLNCIKSVNIKFPMQTTTEAELAREQLEKLERICDSLKDTPNLTLEYEYPSLFSILKNDLCVLLDFASKKVEKLKQSIKGFENALQALGQRRLTRSASAIFQGHAPLSIQSYFELSNLQENTVGNEEAHDSDPMINNSNMEYDSQEDLPGGKLPTIHEEDVFHEEMSKIMHTINDLIKNDANHRLEPQDLCLGVQKVNEQYGVLLSPNDPLLLKNLENINTSKLMLQEIVDTTSKENVEDCLELSPISSFSADEVKHHSTPNPKGTIDKAINFDIYEDNTSATNNAPKHVRFNVDSHEEHQIIEQDLQDLGEQLYPLVHQLQPKLAKKITGMMLEMPISTIKDIISSEPLLNSYVKKAFDTLAESDQSIFSSESGANQQNFDHHNMIFQEITTSGNAFPTNTLNNSFANMTLNHIPLQFMSSSHTPSSVIYSPHAYNHYPYNKTHNTHGVVYPQAPSQYQQPTYQVPASIPMYPYPQSAQSYRPAIAQFGMNVSQPNNQYQAPIPNISCISTVSAPASFQANPSVVNPNQGYDQTSNAHRYNNMAYTGSVPVRNTIIPSYWTPASNLNVSQVPYMNPGINYPNTPETKPWSNPAGSIPTQLYSNSTPANQQAVDTCSKPTLDKDFVSHSSVPARNQNTPAVVELANRNSKELASTCFLVERTISQLSQAATMDSHELMDLLASMPHHVKSVEKLEQKVSSSLKYLITNKQTIHEFDQSLYKAMKQEIDNAEQLSSLLQKKLNEADSVIRAERITTSQLSSAESKQLPYKEFTGNKGLLDGAVYEFFNILDTNFKIARTTDNIKAQVLKKLLKGAARFAIPEDLNDFNQIKRILISRFGNPVIILSDILELHKGIGKIPSKYCQKPPWHKIEDAAKAHLMLIRKAEQLAKNKMAIPEIYASGHRNFHLISLISHENNEDLLAMMAHTDERTMYSYIVQRFEQILATATSNIDHSETKLKRDPKEKKETPEFETDAFALAYGERRPNHITIGSCSQDDCHVCTLLQKKGIGSNYYENHLLHGPSRRSYPNNCPNYISLDMDEKLALVKENKLCQYCLRYKTVCKNPRCGDDHLIPHNSGRPKTYVCQSPSCKNRIELCNEHIDLNKTIIEERKKYILKRTQPDSTIGAFTTVGNPISYNIDTFKGRIKTTIINDIRKCPPDTGIISCDDTMSNTTKVHQWLNKSCNEYQSGAQSCAPNLQADSINSVFDSFKKTEWNQLKDSILYSEPKQIAKELTSHESNLSQDQPLMVESTSDLLQLTKAQPLANDTRSIFIYSRIQGLSRGLSALFDSGGGSSLSLNSIPGRQLYATRKNKKPVYLRGIGSGTTMGIEYTMTLPLNGGGNVAIDVYGVSEILRPMSKIDLEPALKFFKESVKNDDNINETLKDEIAKANIYRFIEGNLDMLLGIKLLGLFPKIVHSLSCGLSIFKMRLKPASKNVLYCLGGPWRYLDNIKNIFPDAAVMLQNIDKELSNWRPSLISNSTLRDIYTISDHESDESDDCNDAVILTVEEPLSTEDRERWQELTLRTLSVFNTHMQYYHSTSRDALPEYASTDKDYDEKAWTLRKTLGRIYRRYYVKYNVLEGIELIKYAIHHLHNCSCAKVPNTCISVNCDQQFIHNLKIFQSFFAKHYGHIKQSFLSTDDARVEVLKFYASGKEDLHKAEGALSKALNQWLENTPPLSQNAFKVSFRGIEAVNDQILCVKPSKGFEMLKSLHEVLMKIFTEDGLTCETTFAPKLAFTKLHEPSDLIHAEMAILSEVDIGESRFNRVQMHKLHNKTPSGVIKHSFLMSLPLIKTNDTNASVNIPMRTTCRESSQNNKNCSKSTIHDDIKHELLWTIKAFDIPEVNFTKREILLFQEEIGEDPKIEDAKQVKKATNKGYDSLLKDLKSIFQEQQPYPRCSSCLGCKECKELWVTCTSNLASTEHYEEDQIRNLIKYDPLLGKFSAELPLKGDPQICLAPNSEQSKMIYFKMVNSLESKQHEKQVVLESFNKLINLGYVKKLTDLNPAVQAGILSKQCYVIPWQIVFKKSSVSTPCRIVLNASSKTKSGKSLNNLLAKGVPKINMLPLILNMTIDPILVTLDLSKFYNSVLIPESQYHLQCLWWDKELDPSNQPELYVLTRHFYGMASSGRILEMCLEMTAEIHKDRSKLYKILTKNVYVDDIFANCRNKEESEHIKRECREILPKMGFAIKGFSESYKIPDDTISELVHGEKCVMALGMRWFPRLDILKYKIPDLDFNSKNSRSLETPQKFTGNSIDEFHDFVPKELTLRMVASKAASIYDPIGYLQPWYLGIKHILRLSCESVNRNWDDQLPDNLRNLWVEKFYELLQLEHVSFDRCTFPANLFYTDITVVGISDYGNIGRLQAFYVLRKINNIYHIQLIYAKSQLRGKKSVPCEELCSLHACAETLSKICTAISDVKRKALLMDSTVVAFWIMKNPMKLAPFQRIRVQNILSLHNKDEIFHVRSSLNTSDIGTKRPEHISCVLPESEFHKGPQYLSLGLDECQERGFIKNVKNVVLDPKLKPLALDGITYKNDGQIVSEIAHQPFLADSNIAAVNEPFTDKVIQRFTFHTYLLNPIAKPWSKCIKILSIVIHFIRRTAFKVSSNKLKLAHTNKLMHSSDANFAPLKLPVEMKETTNYLCHFHVDQVSETINTQILSLSERAITGHTYSSLFNSTTEMAHARQFAVFYFLTLASKELKQFYSSSKLKKHTVCKDNIFYSRQRILESSQVSDVMNNAFNVQELNINQCVPCGDKNSPVAISILMHYHRVICNHLGVDRTWLKCLEAIYIFQGQSLLRNIVKSCFHCKRKLLKKVQTTFGPINRYSLTFAAVNYHVMLDISGPFTVRAKLNAKSTRQNSNNVKIYLLHTICLTSYLNSIAIVETYGSEGFIDGLHRISAKYGYPAVVWTDSSSSQLKALLGINLTMSDMFGAVYQETGIQIVVSGVGPGSHSRQGRIERSIYCFQQFLSNKRRHIANLTILQFDSIISQSMSFMNSMPLCTKERQNGMVSSSLVSPFSFLLGRRSNLRAPASYPTLSNTRGDILQAVEQASEGMFKYFTTAIPQLLLRPASHTAEKKALEVGDVILFPYEESALSITYKLGLIMNLEYDSDDEARIAEIAYCLENEQSLPINTDDKSAINRICRFSRRGVHTLVKIYSCTDIDINTDLDMINGAINEMNSSTTQEQNHQNSVSFQQEPESSAQPNLIICQLGYLLEGQ